MRFNLPSSNSGSEHRSQQLKEQEKAAHENVREGYD